jgi:hypothetical protein
MSYAFVSFISRTTTSRAYNFLLSKGISCQLFSTPREVNVGCGLSVRFSHGDADRVRSLIGSGHPNLVGYFRTSSDGGKRIVTRI